MSPFPQPMRFRVNFLFDAYSAHFCHVTDANLIKWFHTYGAETTQGFAQKPYLVIATAIFLHLNVPRGYFQFLRKCYCERDVLIN